MSKYVFSFSWTTFFFFCKVSTWEFFSKHRYSLRVPVRFFNIWCSHSRRPHKTPVSRWLKHPCSGQKSSPCWFSSFFFLTRFYWIDEVERWGRTFSSPRGKKNALFQGSGGRADLRSEQAAAAVAAATGDKWGSWTAEIHRRHIIISTLGLVGWNPLKSSYYTADIAETLSLSPPLPLPPTPPPLLAPPFHSSSSSKSLASISALTLTSLSCVVTALLAWSWSCTLS